MTKPLQKCFHNLLHWRHYPGPDIYNQKEQKRVPRSKTCVANCKKIACNKSCNKARVNSNHCFASLTKIEPNECPPYRGLRVLSIYAWFPFNHTCRDKVILTDVKYFRLSCALYPVHATRVLFTIISNVFLTLFYIGHIDKVTPLATKWKSDFTESERSLVYKKYNGINRSTNYLRFKSSWS